MSLGLNRTDLNKSGTTYKNGTSIILPHEFGNVVNWAPDPAHFGNPIPSDGNEKNVVNWTPDPAHFGNIFGTPTGSFGFELEDGSGVIVLEDGTSILLLENQS